MPITVADIENDVVGSSLGDRSRLFLAALALPELKVSKAHAETLDGLTVVDDEWRGGRGLSSIWALTFAYRGHQFLIHTNNHANVSHFLVAEEECPDETLLQVLQHFNELSPLRPDEQKASAVSNGIAHSTNWPMLLLIAVVVAVIISVVGSLLHERNSPANRQDRTKEPPPGQSLNKTPDGRPGWKELTASPSRRHT